MLSDHGLKGVFFVEPLFSTRFGPEPLSEIVGILNNGGQEVQLHLHTEWVDEATPPLLPNTKEKREHLKHFNLADQTQLIKLGLEQIHAAGAAKVNAFRAGNFGGNRDTLRALAANGITFDSSYNEMILGPDSGISPGMPLFAPIQCEGVYEYPMTVFKDGLGKLRHAQLSACSTGEFEAVLWGALEAGWKSFVILAHNFELLNQSRDRPDWVAIRRFEKLCKFLDKNKDSFSVRGFHGLTPEVCVEQPTLLSTSSWVTAGRLLDQTYRRVAYR
jgi:hypothetical protein